MFTTFALARHRAYESTAYDFGFFDQVVWNTSEGAWFQTSFVDYNFLGQHFEPILLVFAGLYRLGGGPETILFAQSLFAAGAAIPLFYAAAKIAGSRLAGLSLAIAFLINPALHRALDFDFHPETVSFGFVFSALYFTAASRPRAAALAIVPVLLLKEDMAIVVLAFAAILWSQRHRKQAGLLAAAGVGWVATVVFVLMPLVRGGESDLTQRYRYLAEDTHPTTLVPVATWRGTHRLVTTTAGGAVGMETSFAGLPLIHPASLLALAPAALNGLADHSQQSSLDLQYGVAPLALSVAAAAFALGDIAKRRRVGSFSMGWLEAMRIPVVTSVLVAVAGMSFLISSPFSPFFRHHAPDAAHRQSIALAMELIPPHASVSAQNTLLPHLSQRRQIWEFPDLREAEYVVVDPALPITAQSRAAGYHTVLETLAERGYSNVWTSGTVRVFRRDGHE